MYKVSYYLAGSTQVLYKSFNTLNESTQFANKQPVDSVIEIKFYLDTDNKKPDRN